MKLDRLTRNDIESLREYFKNKLRIYEQTKQLSFLFQEKKEFDK